MSAPQVVRAFNGVRVVRDDLFEGGTKARYIEHLYADGVEEVVYASPAQGGAQSALAAVAKRIGKRATIFVAQRAEAHPRAHLAKSLGATVWQVRPGYLNVVQARARAYVEASGLETRLAPFGFAVDQSTDEIAAAAQRIEGPAPLHVWCAAGSGTLAKGLMYAWPKAFFHLVQVGRELHSSEFFANHRILEWPQPFEKAVANPDFPSDPHYDAKAWAMCRDHIGSNTKAGETTLFWNVTGPA